MLRKAILVLGFFALSGCKLAVILVEGGEVQSDSSATCVVAAPGANGNVCIHEVANTNYAESFEAVPDTGWYFVKWNSGQGFLCADSTNPVCVVTNAPLAGISAVEALVASDATYYIMPIFSDAEFPDTLLADGRLWKQPAVFTNLSWNDVNAVCPLAHGGDCEGTLNGVNVDNWKWASVAELASMLSTYGPAVPQSGGSVGETGSTWAPAFFNAGWQPTFSGGNEKFVAGWTRDEGLDSSHGTSGGIDQNLSGGDDYAYSGSDDVKTLSESYMGVWLYYSQ